MKKLIVPVYLNQRMVFDQIAMLKEGISTVTSITHSESGGTSNQSGVSAEIGSGGVLSSLFRVNLSGKMEESSGQNSETKASENRVHTPASLLYELHNQLEEKEMLLKLGDEVPATGSFVEFKCQLNKNPFLEYLEAVGEIGKVIKMFSDNTAIKTQTGNQNRNKRRNRTTNQTQEISIESTFEIVDEFKKMLTEGNTLDLVGMNVNGFLSAVITLEDRFLNDPQMSDLIDGEFNVLGVVVKSIQNDSGSISLTRKTTFSRLPSGMTDPLFKGLENFQTELELELPPLNVEIFGPAIQVLPVAIFA